MVANLLQAMKAHFLDIVIEYLNLGKVDRVRYLPHRVVKKLPAQVSKIWTFSLVDVEEGSVQGNLESLGYYVKVVLGRDLGGLIGELVLCSGDQLTLDRWRSILKLKDTEPGCDRFDWVLPILGLFHTKQTYYKMLAHSHWGGANEVSSISTAKLTLGRDKVDEKCSDLWAMKSLTDHMGDAHVLAILVEELKAGDWEFNHGNGDAEISDWDALKRECERDMDRVVRKISGIIDKLLLFKSVVTLRDSGKPRDFVRENSLLFLQHYLMVREYGEACVYGDIGRVKDLLDIWTLCFLGGKHYKYAIEMLEIQCGFQKEWTPELQEVVLQNWLVNPTGVAGHFLPVDEFQEECVRAIKHIHNPGGPERVGEYLRETLARLKCPFMNIRSAMDSVTGAVDYRGGHSRQDACADVMTLFKMYNNKSVFAHIMGRGGPEGQIRGALVKEASD